MKRGLMVVILLVIASAVLFHSSIEDPTGLVFLSAQTDEHVIYDEQNLQIGRAVFDSPDIETTITRAFVGAEEFELQFHHDSEKRAQVILDGSEAELSTNLPAQGEKVILKINLSNGAFEPFTLRVGEDVFEFSYTPKGEAPSAPPEPLFEETPPEQAPEPLAPIRTTSSDGRSTQLVIGACGTAVNESSTLSGPISSTGSCLSVTADNLTLDCLGNSITHGSAGASSTTGLSISGRQNIQVVNCIIIDPSNAGSGSTGISVSSSSNVNISDSTVRGNGTTNIRAILISGSGNVSVRNNHIIAAGTAAVSAVNVTSNSLLINISGNTITRFATGAGGGIVLQSLSTLNPGNNISTNTIRGNGSGMQLVGPVINVTIENNDIRTTGIGIESTTTAVAANQRVENNTIFQNTIHTNTTTAINFGGFFVNTNNSYNRILSNTINSNGSGIVAGGSAQELQIRDNIITVAGRTGVAISLTDSAHNISGNTLTVANQSHSIRLGGNESSHNVSIDNTVNGDAFYYYGGTGASPACPNGGSINLAAGRAVLVECNSVSAIGYSPEDGMQVIRSNDTLIENLFSPNDGLSMSGSRNTLRDSFISTTDVGGVGVSIGAGSGLLIEDNRIFSGGPGSSNLGVVTIDQYNATIRDNNISATGTFGNYGGSFDTSLTTVTATNFSFYGNRVVANGTTCGFQFGIEWEISHSLIENNTITTDGICGSNEAISDGGAVNVTVRTNILRPNDRDTPGNGCCNYAINGGTNWTIELNDMRTNGSGCCNAGVVAGAGIDNTTIRHNSIVTDGFDCCHSGLEFYSFGNNGNRSAYNNTINTNGGGSGDCCNYGAYIDRSIGDAVFNNSISTNGVGDFNYGVYLFAQGGVNNLMRFARIENNTIRTNGTARNHGVSAQRAHNNTIQNNIIITNTSQSYAYATESDAAKHNILINNTFNTTEWIQMIAGTNASFINNTFVLTNSTIKIYAFNITGANVVNRTHLNSTLTTRGQIQVFLNSTAKPVINTSAELTFIDVNGSNFYPKVSHSDNATYEFCPEEMCKNVTFDPVGGDVTYNVTQFTSHTLQICPLNISADMNLTEDIACPRTAINITSSNVVLDCKGFRVLYDGFGEGNDSGITANGASNLTVQNCRILDVNGTGSNSSGIRFVNVDNSFIANNLIRTNASHNSSAVRLEDSELIAVNDNTLVGFGDSGDNMGANVQNSAGIFFRRNTIDTFGFLGSDNYGILLNGSTNSSFVLHTNITTRGFDNNHGVFVRENSSVNAINNNTINATGTFNVSGILLFLNVFNTSITNNTIIAEGTNSTSGIKLQVFSDRSQIINNTITVLGSDSNNSGIRFFSLSRNNTIKDTVIFVNGTQDNIGIYLSNGSDENSFNNTLLTVTGPSSYGIIVNSIGYNAWFNRTVLLNVTEWIVSSIGTPHDYDFENTSFVRPFGNITFVQNFTISGVNDINSFQFNITDNRSFVNSSMFAFLNRSAEIRLDGILLGNPEPFFDFEDDNTYTLCLPPQCTELGFAGNIFLFNVSRWTTYVAAEFSSVINITLEKNDSPDSVLAGSQLNYSILVNVTEGTAFNVSVNESYPSEVIFSSSEPSPTSGNNTFLLGNLTGEFIINITVNVSASVPNGTVINNTVNVTFENSTGGIFTLQDTENTTVLFVEQFNETNITFSKTSTPNPVNANELLTYNLTINITSGNAFNVTVTDTVPPDTTFVSSEPIATGANNTYSLGNMTNGTVFIINITVNVSNVTLNGTSLNNTANITFTNETGSVLSANATTNTTVNVPPVIVTINKTGTPNPVLSGTQLNYSITINVTNGTAINVTINETYPPQTTFVTSQPPPTSGNNIFELGSLSNTAFQVNITVLVSAATVNNTLINNTANITFIAATPQSIQTTENTTVLSCAVFSSNISSSTFLNCTIDSSNITNSTIIDSLINSSTVNGSTIINSTKINSTIINSTIINATNQNCVIINGVEIGGTCSNSSVINTNTTNATIADSNLSNTTIIDSNITNSTIGNGTIDDSIVINSTIINGTINDSTLNNTNTTNSNVTDSLINNTEVINSSVTDSNITNTTMNDSTVSNSTVNNSVFFNSTIENGTYLNATVENGTCIAGTIIFAGQTFICPVNLSTVYAAAPSAPVFTGGGGGGGGGFIPVRLNATPQVPAPVFQTTPSQNSEQQTSRPTVEQESNSNNTTQQAQTQTETEHQIRAQEIAPTVKWTLPVSAPFIILILLVLALILFIFGRKHSASTEDDFKDAKQQIAQLNSLLEKYAPREKKTLKKTVKAK